MGYYDLGTTVIVPFESILGDGMPFVVPPGYFPLYMSWRRERLC